MQLINNITSNFMNDSDYYLEVGSYRGKSLIAALYQNQIRAYVIEAFEKHLPDGLNIKRIWNENIDIFKIRDRITLFEEDYRLFHEDLPSISFLYYDANHDSGHTYEALKKLENYLADQAIIMVDDYYIKEWPQPLSYPGYEKTLLPVKIDVDRWLIENQYCKLIKITNWINGQAIMIYNRKF
jgi:predicted O-methyltransferase YrrM